MVYILIAALHGKHQCPVAVAHVRRTRALAHQWRLLVDHDVEKLEIACCRRSRLLRLHGSQYSGQLVIIAHNAYDVTGEQPGIGTRDGLRDAVALYRHDIDAITTSQIGIAQLLAYKRASEPDSHIGQMQVVYQGVISTLAA